MDQSKKPIYKEHYELLRSFYDGHIILNLTVRELKDRYEQNQEEKSLQTIYRWVDLLKNEGILIEAGFKITPHTESKQGRKTETLYCPVSDLFFFKAEPLQERWFNKKEVIQKYSNDLHVILSSVLNEGGKLEEIKLDKAIQKYEEDKIKVLHEIVSTANDNPELLSVYQGMSESEIANITLEAAAFISITKNSELLNYLISLSTN